MNKFSKPFLGATVALSLTAASLAVAQPARADFVEPTLTYANWLATSEQQDFAAAQTASLARLEATPALETHYSRTTVGPILGETTFDEHVFSNKSKSIASASWVDNASGDQFAYVYYFANGTFLESLDCFQSGDTWVKQPAQALARLGKPNATTINDETATVPDGLSDIRPVGLWSAAGQDLWEGLGFDPSTLLFSPVVKSNPQAAPTETMYAFSAKAPIEGTPYFDNITVAQTFNAGGFLKTVAASQHSTSGNFDISMTLNQTELGSTVIEIPASNKTVTAKQFVSIGHKIDAEDSVTAKAKAIAAKAKALAKKANATVAAKHVTAAAKALKAKVKAVKNGVKLTGKSAGVSGSMCVISAKGKVTVAHCN